MEEVEVSVSLTGTTPVEEYGHTVKFQEDGKYGWLSLKPRYLQCFNTIRWHVFWQCIFNFFEGFQVNGIINAILPALEKRYALSSFQSGLITSSNEFGAFLCYFFIGYFGEQRHKPRILGTGIILMSVGCLIFSLPQFIGGKYEYTVSDVSNASDNLCNKQNYVNLSKRESNVGEAQNSNTVMYALFLIGQILIGVGASPMFTLGLTYIDENCKPKLTSLYISWTFCFAAIGVAIGYIVGGQVLSLYVDINRVDPSSVHLTSMDPQWVGAWWIGTTISIGAFLIVAVPILGYPKRLSALPEKRKNVFLSTDGSNSYKLSTFQAPSSLKDDRVYYLIRSDIGMQGVQDAVSPQPDEGDEMEMSGFSNKAMERTEFSFKAAIEEMYFILSASEGYQQLQQMRRSEVHTCTDNELVAQASFGKSMKDFPKALLTLLRNTPFLLVSLAGTMEVLVIEGLATFGMKILHQRFNVDLPTAGLAFGIVTLTGSSGGMLLGGYLVKRFQLKYRGIMRLCSGFMLISLLLSPTFLIYCSSPSIHGVSVLYPGQDTYEVLSSRCNEECGCTTASFEPVCSDRKDAMFFNPCFAGCSLVMPANGSKMFRDCTCYSGIYTNITNPYMMSGACTNPCDWLYVYCVLIFVIMIMTFATMSPGTTATFRCVPNEQRSVAIGISVLIVRLLGKTPGPVLLGTIIDSTCQVWESKGGSDIGACWVYNSFDMGVRLMIWWIALKATGAILFLIASFMDKPPSENEPGD